MLEKVVSVISVGEVSKSVVYEVSVVFGGWGKVDMARFSMSVTRISASATVRGDPIGPPVTCL